MNKNQLSRDSSLESAQAFGIPKLMTVGVFSIFAFSLLDLPWVEAAHWALGMMLITFFAAIPAMPRPIRRDPAWWFLYGGFALAFLTYATSNFQFPEYAEPYPKLDVMGSLFLFFPIAWWLRGNTRYVTIVYAMALVGFGLALFRFGSSADLVRAFDGARPTFGFRQQHAAVFFGTALLGWVIFARRLVIAESRRATILRGLGWSFVFVLVAGGALVTQTRAVWLGLIAATVVLIALHLTLHKRLFSLRNGALAATALVVLVSAGLMSGAGQIIADRVSAERPVVTRILSGDIEDLPYTSIGIRIHLWAEAWRWIEQRPITGWGYTGKKQVIDESPRFSPEFKEKFGHLHSSVFGMWVTFGLLGLALLAWLAVWIGFTTWRSYRDGRMPYDVFLFGMGFFPYFFVINQFESYLIWGTGVYLMAIVAGTLYSYHLQGKMDAQTLPGTGT